jgi:uncharacterized protein (DUF58 family)
VAAVPFEFNGVVRLTSIGAGHVLLTLVLGFAAINTGNNSLYLALAFLLGSLLLSGMASKGGLRHIQVELLPVDEAWAGQPMEGLLRVRNRSRLWNVRDIAIVLPELHQPILVPRLVRRRALEIPAKLLFQRRGRVSFTHVDLYTRYPFGFFLKKRRHRLNGEAIVFPRLLSEAERREAHAPEAGDVRGANRPGPGTEIFAFREYVRGDSLRYVHWRKSASVGRWIMKQLEHEWVPSVVVVVDPVLPAAATPEQFEHLVSAAATFLHAAIQEGRSVTLHLPLSTISGDGRVGRRSLFQALALLEPLDPSGAAMLIHEPGDVVFSLRKTHESQVA